MVKAHFPVKMVPPELPVQCLRADKSTFSSWICFCSCFGIENLDLPVLSSMLTCQEVGKKPIEI